MKSIWNGSISFGLVNIPVKLDPSIENLDLLKDVAIRLKNILEKIGLKPFIMTSGGKGFHIWVPIKEELSNKEVRNFALKIAEVLVKNDSENLTTQLLKSKRKKKIFIDINRNSLMQTSICPYGVRAKPNLPIACPFNWKDLNKINPDFFSIKNPPKKDAWKNFTKNAVSLKKIIKNLKE